MPDIRPNVPSHSQQYANFMNTAVLFERENLHSTQPLPGHTYFFQTPQGMGQEQTLLETALGLPLHTTPRFRSKPVCKLICRYCSAPVCHRGMKAILLADSGVELFSTDSPPPTVGFIKEDYVTEKCMCRIRDIACLSCGNLVGYHVTQPCKACLASCNNGHFWMFHKEHVSFSERTIGNKSLVWAELPGIEKDTELYERKWEARVR
ncbi:Protein fam72b [Coelomomyces lativittatus]|nr:Protein fam72b [Coelomomyces lativittatus]KAJ1504003.1 Protein fam72b [Coelomomyces lativittatus]KAJ1513932.1 Protein fam72b [Coelomomyces lativittatus]